MSYSRLIRREIITLHGMACADEDLSETVSAMDSRSRQEHQSLLSEMIRIRSSLNQFRDDMQHTEQSAKARNFASDSVLHSKIDNFNHSTSSALQSISSSTRSIQSSVLSLRDIGQQILHFLNSFPREIRDLLRHTLRMNFHIYHLLVNLQNSMGRSPGLLLESNIRFEDALGRTRELPYQWFRHWEVS
jgi:hypothetical protein